MLDRKAILSPESGPTLQFLKYAVCGGIATATNILIFYLLGWRLLPCMQPDDFFVRLLHLHVPAIDVVLRKNNATIANTIAFLISNFVAYLLNIWFVFRAGRHHRLVELGLFYAVSAVSFVIGTLLLMRWLIGAFGMMTTIAFASNMVVALLINFAMRKFVIFKG
jgi:putative flippase GtrA